MTMCTMMTMIAPLLVATPAFAQTPPPAASPASAPVFAVPPIPPTDPVRLAAARPVIDRIWPDGTYAHVIHVMMDQLIPASMAQTFAMKPSDLLAGLGGKPGAKTGEKSAAGETIGQMAAKNDPYFQQRMAITLRVIGDEMGRLMTETEPSVRDALAHAYARRFTVAQLAELDHFFATPTGKAYVADSLTLMMSPDMPQALQDFTPRFIKAMPEIIAKVTEATKDLPPAGKNRSAPPPVVPPPPPVKKP